MDTLSELREPCFPLLSHDSPDRRYTTMEVLRASFQRLAIAPQLVQLSDLILGKHMRAFAGAAMLCVRFTPSIDHVVGSGAEIHMGGIAAQCVIALMIHA